MTMLLLSAVAAWATTGFDPSAPAARFEGEEIYTQDGATLLWSAIERLEDPDRTLLIQEDYTAGIAWPDETAFAPWIATCFGTSEPGSWSALLHMARAEGVASGTPILLVPGAGDNASRGFITMASRLNNNTGRPVYALTFAHPHGDVFRHAELIADAIARIRYRTGAEQVDLVAHSKGGIAAAVYLSNHKDADWSRADYADVGTVYQGDVRKAVFVATPLGGIDTAYRWTQGNLAALSDDAVSPNSWSAYYPAGIAAYWNVVDLGGLDFLPADGDPFPGHRQLLARWDDVYPLPGEQPELGYYAMQTDWYTTYYGGVGFYSESAGIDVAIAQGDDVLGSLAENGVDPDIRLYILAGDSPLMPNGLEDYLAASVEDSTWIDLVIASVEVWGAFISELVSGGVLGGDLTDEEIRALAQGKLLLGEISGESDGLVFVDSATQSSTLTARGAVVVETEIVNLSHLDLLYASEVTASLLIAAGEADPVSDGWMVAVGERYREADSLGWVEAALAEDDAGDTGSPDDTGSPGDTGADDDTGAGVDNTEPTSGGCGACSATAASGTSAWMLAGLGLLCWRRRTHLAGL